MAAAALALIIVPQVITIGFEQQAAKPDEGIVFVRPTRRPAGAMPKGPAPVPSIAEQAPPLTLDVLTRYQSQRGRLRSVRHSVSRTHDRIHLALPGRREWLLLRNPVDPRRVSGLLVDHAARVIVVHEESELRSRLGISGWADALLLGFDPELVPRLQAGAQTRTIAGVRFARQRVVDGPAELSEVWWNAEFALPGAFTVQAGGGSTRISIERIVRDVDSVRLQLPPSRFPSYRLMDLADWLERD